MLTTFGFPQMNDGTPLSVPLSQQQMDMGIVTTITASENEDYVILLPITPLLTLAPEFR